MNIKDKTGPLSRIMPAVSQVASNVWNPRVIFKEHQMLTTLLFLIFMAIAQPLWHGYQFGVSDHSIQFSIMNRIMDDTLYPNDPMLDTAKGYVSFFPSLMVILIKATGDMEKLYFGLHILSYFLYFTLVYYITRLLFDRFSAVVCVSLMSTSKIVLGGSSIHFTGLYPSLFMLPFVLLAVYLFLRERYAVAYAILGVSLNFHTLISSYMFCMFFCHSALAIIFSKDSKVAAVKNLSKQVGLFALCALPALVWILSTHGEMTDEWIRLLRVRSSHHSFPLSWAGSHYVNFLLLLAAGALSFLYAPIANFHRKMLAFVFAIAILCTAGLVFAEYYPVKSVLRGQFFRSTNFLAIFCVMYVSNYLRHSWGRSILHKAACAIIFLALFMSSYFNLLVLGLILAVVADNLLLTFSATSSPTLEVQRPFAYLCIPLFVVVAIVVRSVSPHDSFPNSFNLNGIMSLLSTFFENRLLLLLICAAIVLMAISNLKRAVQKLVTLMIAAVLVIYIAPTAYTRLHPENRCSEGWRAMQGWAKANTPKDALFLTPPYMTGFRIFSQRSIVGEWKDGTQQYFDADYSYEWWRRMQDVRSANSGSRDFDKLETSEYIALSKKYDASYLVLPSSASPSLPKVYGNSKYAVYRFE